MRNMKPWQAQSDRRRAVPASRVAPLAALAAVLTTFGSPRAVWSHDLFAAYVQHRVQLTVSAQHTDVTIELTFFEDASEHEREHLDTDGNGRVSVGEREAYLRRLAPALEERVRLKTGRGELPLTSLYSPRLDLLGNDQVGRGHHRLTLFWFAPTPEDLKSDTEFVFEDRLWPDVRALGSLEVEGKEGCRLEASPRGDPLFPPARNGEAREFKARCLHPPNHTSQHELSSSPRNDPPHTR